MALALVGLCMVVVGVLVYDDARSLRTCGIRVCSMPPFVWGVLVAVLPPFGILYLARRPHAVRVGQRPRKRARRSLEPPAPAYRPLVPKSAHAAAPAPLQFTTSTPTPAPRPVKKPVPQVAPERAPEPAPIRWSSSDYVVDPPQRRRPTGAGVA